MFASFTLAEIKMSALSRLY